MKVVALDRCARCGEEFVPGDDVSRYRVSRTPGEWIDEATHMACENEGSEFTGGPVFTKVEKPSN